MDEGLLRSLTPFAIGILGRRGADVAAAEDAVQAARLKARLRGEAAGPRRSGVPRAG